MNSIHSFDVSIILPSLALNEVSLARACESVDLASQNLTAQLILVVPADIAINYLPILKNVSLKILKDNQKGIYEAFNLGLREAEGKYICFMGDDDFITKDSLVKRAQHLSSTDAEAVYGNSIFVERVRKFDHPSNSNVLERWWEDLLPIQHAAFMYRRECFNNSPFKTNLWFMDLKICSDYEWQSRFIKGNPRIDHLPIDVVYIGLSGISNSRKFRVQFEALFIALINKPHNVSLFLVLNTWLKRLFSRFLIHFKWVKKGD